MASVHNDGAGEKREVALLIVYSAFIIVCGEYFGSWFMLAAADARNNQSIILDEEIDPNYVPKEDEVLEYAKWLGMDLEKDKDLFWIAQKGLMVSALACGVTSGVEFIMSALLCVMMLMFNAIQAPLPRPWKPCKDLGSDDIYYFNFDTGERFVFSDCVSSMHRLILFTI